MANASQLEYITSHEDAFVGCGCARNARNSTFTGAGAPPPARTDADAWPRIRSSSARHGRRRVDPKPGHERPCCGRGGCARLRKRALDPVFGLGVRLHLRSGVRRRFTVAPIQPSEHHDRDRLYDEYASRRSSPGTGRESAARRWLPAAGGEQRQILGAQRRIRLGPGSDRPSRRRPWSAICEAPFLAEARKSG